MVEGDVLGKATSSGALWGGQFAPLAPDQNARKSLFCQYYQYYRKIGILQRLDLLCSKEGSPLSTTDVGAPRSLRHHPDWQMNDTFSVGSTANSKSAASTTPKPAENPMAMFSRILISAVIGAGMAISSPQALAYTKKQAENWCKRHSSCSKRNGEHDTAYYDGDKLKFDCPLKGNGNCVILLTTPPSGGNGNEHSHPDTRNEGAGGPPGSAG